MFKKALYTLLVVGTLIFSYSCKSYNKTLKSANNELKYETGIDLYENGDFNKALQFFDVLRAVYRGTDRGQELAYYTANCYFQLKNYEIASHYYKQYAQMYPMSDKAEEASFLSAYCNYLASPRPTLDQSNTFLALKELQLFIDMYPKSSKVDEANKLMDDLRNKLEIKNYNIGKLYYRMEDFQAAITSFQNLLEDFPDTEYKEEILYYITKAYFVYAEKSIYTKKLERYEKTIEAYNNLLFLYPESEYLREVESINENAREKLKN
ncbi:MAG: outer membrane protein assembly factor BamD [Bacteroidetes bacterium]|nr:outer membrane protein assembly factor BamD [Bacteroidota bacterium]